jgi:hypothetical protein
LKTKRIVTANLVMCTGIGIAILLIFILVSGCSANGDDDQSAKDNDVANTQGVQNANPGTPGVENTYIAADYDFSSENIGYSGCVFYAPLLLGDTIEVTVTTENPVDFISGDSWFYTSVVINLGEIDPSLTIYPEESLSNSDSYYLNSQIDRNSFAMVVRNPTGDYKNIRGHVKILVHSKFARSEYDTKSTKDGIIAARDAIQYAYITQEWDFTSEKYGATDCISSVYLMPGDIVEATFTMENPVDFISGNYAFDLNFWTNSGRTANSQEFTVYQSESYSNAKTYHLLKQIDRKWFVLAVRNPTGDYKNIKGHKKIVIYSKFTDQEHKDAFERDYNRVMSFWGGVGKDASKPPYTMGYSTVDPSDSYGLLKQNLFNI